MAVTAAPKTIRERLVDARREAVRLRAQGESDLADHWDEQVNRLLDLLPRRR